jgi:hypothetical protein
MAISKQESSERLRRALRRKNDFAALAEQVRDALRSDPARRPGAPPVKRPRPEVRLNAPASRVDRGSAGPSRGGRAAQPGRRGEARLEARLSIDELVAELNRRLFADPAYAPGTRYLVAGTAERWAAWEGPEAMRPLVSRLARFVADELAHEIPFRAEPIGRRSNGV